MRVTAVSVNVRYSKPMADGSHKTVELGIEGSLTSSDEEWREVQRNLYHELGEQMRYVFSSNGSGKAIQETPTPELPSPKSEHWCQEQGQEFKAKTGQYGVFYSHPLPGKKWCNER